MAKEFDLDVTFDENEPDLSALSADEMAARVASLPEALMPVAQGILVENRTMSDVSQSLGIRQAELVSRLHRARQIISAGNS
jgi:DNA-directed RNA polymerase specialized sigma24 family protein